jgi:uncharacterized protein YcbK (DUF882 family)
VLAPLTFVFAAALHLPLPADSAALPGSVAYIDAAATLAGPLGAVAAHLEPGAIGGTEVELYNVNSHESLSLYLRFDGVMSDDTAKQVSRFLRCKRTGRHRKMNAGVIGLLAQVASHYPDHVVEVVSGYRARPFGKPHSKHFTGHAIDFRIRGVKTKEVRTLAWSLESPVGVGYYRGEDFLHLDYRPGEKKIAWEQRRMGRPNHYNPRWSRVEPRERPNNW